MNPNPKQRSRGRGNNGGNPNRINHGGGGHGGGHSGGGGGGGHVRNINVRSQVFDSNGPEGRIRGNAHQVMEKYLALARDAASQGDRHAAENFYQHAEHYFRLINAYNQNNGQRRPQNLPTPAEDQAEMPPEDEDGEGQSQHGQQQRDDQQGHDDAGDQGHANDQGGDERAPRYADEDRPRREPRQRREPREPREQRQPAPVEAAEPVVVAEPVVAVEPVAVTATEEEAPARPVRRRVRRPAADAAEPAPAQGDAEPVLI